MIFVAWVNLHGGFLLGMVVLLFWSAAHLVVLVWREGGRAALRSPKARRVVAVAVVSMLATLVNPYGWRLLAFLVRPVTVVRPEITEWQPLSITSPYGVMYLWLVFVVGAGLAYSRRERHPALVALCACLALAPLTAVRHGALATLALAILAGEHVGDVSEARAPGVGGGARERAGAAKALGSRGRCVAGERVRPGGKRTLPLHRAGSRCRHHPGPRGRASEGQRGGGQPRGVLRLGRVRPMAPEPEDQGIGRRPSGDGVFRCRVYTRSTNFWLGIKEWDAILRTTDTELALVSSQFPSLNLMKLAPGWVLVHEDPLAGLFARADSAAIAQIRSQPVRAVSHDGWGTCFP